MNFLTQNTQSSARFPISALDSIRVVEPHTADLSDDQVDA